MTRFDNLVRSILQFEAVDGDRAEAVVEKALPVILNRFDADSIAVHGLEPGSDLLDLKAARGLPAELLEKTRRIPVGKGIAGETARTGQPVTSCNIREDVTGVVQPGAKRSGMGGALCVPLLVRDGGGDRIAGTLGIGTRAERTFTEEETQNLIAVGRVLGEHLSQPTRV